MKATLRNLPPIALPQARRGAEPDTTTHFMRFVFSKLFYALLAVGLLPLSLSWNRPLLAWLALAYDLILITIAIFDAWNARLPARVNIERHFSSRFAVG